MTKDEVRTQLQYLGWAVGRLLEAAAALPPETVAKDFGVSHHSIEETLAHCFQSERVWLARVVRGPRTTLRDPGDGPYDLAFLRREWPALQAGWMQWLESAEDFDALCSYRNLRGVPFETPYKQIVLHVVNHFSIHTGQVTGMLRQSGVVPPDMDLIIFYRESAG